MAFQRCGAPVTSNRTDRRRPFDTCRRIVRPENPWCYQHQDVGDDLGMEPLRDRHYDFGGSPA
jgi:hypothetical protein